MSTIKCKILKVKIDTFACLEDGLHQPGRRFVSAPCSAGSRIYRIC